MTRFAILTVLLLSATPAVAQQSIAGPGSDSAASEVVFEGTARPGCLLAPVTSVAMTNASLTARDSSSASIVISPGSFVDPRTGVPNPVTMELALPVTCNTAHSIEVTSTRGGLTNEGIVVADGQFRSIVPLDVALGWSGTTSRFNTSETRTTLLSVGNAATGLATITISTPGGGVPLTAGNYSDIIVVKVTTTS